MKLMPQARLLGTDTRTAESLAYERESGLEHEYDNGEMRRALRRGASRSGTSRVGGDFRDFLAVRIEEASANGPDGGQ